MMRVFVSCDMGKIGKESRYFNLGDGPVQGDISPSPEYAVISPFLRIQRKIPFWFQKGHPAC